MYIKIGYLSLFNIRIIRLISTFYIIYIDYNIMKTFNIFNNYFIFYEDGRVYKLDKRYRIYTKITKKNTGYQTISCRNGDKIITFYLHRLIYQAFNPDENIQGMQIDHIDRDRSNNKIDNLRCVKRSKNLLNRKFRKIIKI